MPLEESCINGRLDALLDGVCWITPVSLLGEFAQAGLSPETPSVVSRVGRATIVSSPATPPTPRTHSRAMRGVLVFEQMTE